MSLKEQIKNGSNFEVDLKNRVLRIKKETVELVPIHNDKLKFEEIVDKLYERYQHSVPSARNEGRRHRYFAALKAEELTDAELVVGVEREVAQMELEVYILRNILGGFGWPYDGWFKKLNSGAILLKEWFV